VLEKPHLTQELPSLDLQQLRKLSYQIDRSPVLSEHSEKVFQSLPAEKDYQFYHLYFDHDGKETYYRQQVTVITSERNLTLVYEDEQGLHTQTIEINQHLTEDKLELLREVQLYPLDSLISKLEYKFFQKAVDTFNSKFQELKMMQNELQTLFERVHRFI